MRLNTGNIDPLRPSMLDESNYDCALKISSSFRDSSLGKQDASQKIMTTECHEDLVSYKNLIWLKIAPVHVRAQEESLILPGSDQSVKNRVLASMNLVVVISCSPCSPCSYFSRTYWDLWYRWVYYNGMDYAEWKPNMQDMQDGSYPTQTKNSVVVVKD